MRLWRTDSQARINPPRRVTNHHRKGAVGMAPIEDVVGEEALDEVQVEEAAEAQAVVGEGALDEGAEAQLHGAGVEAEVVESHRDEEAVVAVAVAVEGAAAEHRSQNADFTARASP